MKNKNRVVVVVLGVVCLVLVGIALKMGIEKYYIKKLYSPKMEEALDAAQVLSRIGLRAYVPHFLSAIKAHEEESILLVSEYVNESHYECTPVIYELHKMGLTAFEEVKEEFIRVESVVVDSEGERRYRSILFMLMDAFESKQVVRRVEYRKGGW